MAAMAPFAARAEDKVLYGPPPAWVVTAPIAASPTASASPEDNGVSPPLKFLSTDTQSNFTVKGVAEYVALKVKILTPEGLPMGNFAREWDPATDTLTVHRLTIERDGKIIDVLQPQKFEILRREASLEQSMLDGRLTATLQIHDLRVGDVLDAAMTLTRSQPVLAGHNATMVLYGPSARIDKTRVRLVWDKAAPLRWRFGSGLPQPKVTETPTGGELLFEAADMAGPTLPEFAPARFSYAGVIQASQAGSWQEISRSFYPGFEGATKLEANSPLKAEIEKIRAAASTPTERASLALKLVQDQVRYVAINMNAQGYTPVAADETWRRRFGDCKGKTVLLIALLRALDIEATAAVVTSSGGQALDSLLPRADSFDHVIVRATIAGKTYWLDGTRSGGGPIEVQAKPDFGWALPLTAAGSDLQRLRPDRLERPSTQLTLNIDASAGLDKPAPADLEVILRDGDVGASARTLAATPKAQLDRALISQYQDYYDGLRLTALAWRYDARQGRLVLNFKGVADPEVTASGGDVSYEVPGSALYPLDLELRPAGQDQSVPYDVDDPEYVRRLTVVTLPKDSKTYTVGGGWSYQAIAGQLRTRWFERQGDRVVMLRSTRGIAEELSPAEMAMDVETARNYRANVIRIVGVSKPPKANAKDGAEDQSGRLKLNNYLALDIQRMAAMAALDKPGRDALLAFGEQLSTLQARKDYAGVLKALDQTKLDLTPFGDTLTRQRFATLMDLKRDTEAFAMLDRAIATAPTATLLIDRSLMHTAAGRGAEAKADIEAALALDPESLYALQAAVDNAAFRADYLRQIELRRRIVRLQPDEPDEWLKLGAFATAAGQYADAEQAYDDAREAGGGELSLLLARATLMKKTNRNAEAMALYDTAVALKPEQSETLNNVCWGRAIANLQLEKALGECRRAVAINPEPHRLDSLAFVELRLGRYADAIADYNKALAKNPKLSASLYGRGIAKLNAGQVEAGRADIAAAAAISPKVAEGFAGYGVSPP